MSSKNPLRRPKKIHDPTIDNEGLYNYYYQVMKNLDSIPKICLAALSVFLLCSLANVAEAKVQKFRGHIISVDFEAKTFQLDHAKGERTMKWNDSTRMPGPLEIKDLKAGMWVRNIMNDPDDGFIAVIRHFPEKDKKEEGAE